MEWKTELNLPKEEKERNKRWFVRLIEFIISPFLNN